MACPYYKNKEIFDGFNEIVEAFGGKPLTEDEFKSSELRNKREGLDRQAMEAAYTAYDRNNGNFLDKTPTGEDSILFLTLLDHFKGDKKSAIVAKANVYTDEFVNWFGDWLFLNQDIDLQTKDQVSLIFKRIPQLSEIGTEEQYAQYIQTIFPNSQDKSVYWHGSDSDFSRGFKSAKRGEGSGASETKERNDFYLAKQAWAVLLYVSGINRKSVDKNGFSHWNKLWWELKEIMSNGRRENNEWKNLTINEQNVRLAIPNKKGIFDRNQGKGHGKWLKERKADYGYENKSDKEFFEEILGVRWGVDTFNTWTQRNAEIFKSLLETESGIYPAVINTVNPIRENGQDTYYEEHRGLFTKADADGNDAILGSETDNEFGSDVAVVLRDNSNIHFLGTQEDMDAFSKFVNSQNVSKVVDENGEPLVVYHGTKNNWTTYDISKFKRDQFGRGIYLSEDKDNASQYGETKALFVNARHPFYTGYLYDENQKYSDRAKAAGYLFNHESIDKKDYVTKLKGNIDNYEIIGEELKNADAVVVSYKEHINEPAYKFGEIVVSSPNQIKHVENLGTWNPNNPNIYHITAEPNTVAYRLESVTLDSFFGESLQTLQSENGVVSTLQIILHLIDTGSFAEYNQQLAEIFQKHDIPVIFAKLPKGRPMDAVETENGVYIEIDPDLITYYTKEKAAEYLLHEVVHALSVKSLLNPLTTEEHRFAEDTSKLYFMLDKLIPESEWSRSSMDTGGYILSDIFEFAAVFATDKDTKYALYKKVLEKDKQTNNKLFLRLKQFINSLSRLILNRNVFKNVKSDQLKLYEKQLNKFLVSRNIVGNKNIVEYFNYILDNTDQTSINNQNIANLRESLARSEYSFIRHYVVDQQQQQDENDATQYENLWRSRMEITEYLQTRFAAIKSSTIDDEIKVRAAQIVDALLKQFKNKKLPTIVVLRSFLQDTLPQLMEDVSNVRNVDSSTHSYYMYNMHDNFGAYVAIFQKLSQEVSNKLYRKELEKEFSQLESIDKVSSIKNIEDLLSIIDDAADVARKGVSMMYNILMENVRKDLEGLSKEINYNNTKEVLDSMYTIGVDTNWFINNMGSKDGAQDPLLRSIVYLVNNAISKTKDQVRPVATKLLKLKENLKIGESVLDLYELDEGKTTQFLVRELNFGKFYKDYRQFIESLNEKYDLPKENRHSPEDPTKRREYNREKNKWLSEHCERRFLPKYYEAYDLLSDDTLEQLNSIRSAISQIKQNAYDKEDGMYHFERLTKEEWNNLQALYIRKRILGSDYTLYGEEKIKGTDAYRWAKEIQQLNKTLYDKDEFEIKRDTEKWQEARNKIIKQAIEDNTVNGETDYYAVDMVVREWDDRNSKRVFIEDENEKLAIFNYIEQLTERLVGFKKPVYDFNGDGGKTYEENNKRINKIIGLFRDYNTGEPNLIVMPARTKAVLKKLEDENKKIKKAAIAKDTTGELKRKSKLWGTKYKQVFNKYLKTRYTKYYYMLNHPSKINIESSTDEVRKVIKKRWETILEVKEGHDDDDIPYIDKFTDLIPGDGWINRDENNSLLNPVYAEMNMKVPYIPKKKLEDGSRPYDNSKQYNKIMNSDTLRALYEAIVGNKETGEKGILLQANEKLFTRLYQDDYMLPGITGSMWKYMKNQDATGAVTQALLYAGDHLGFSMLGITQDLSFGLGVFHVLDKLTDLQEIVNENENLFGGQATGVRPDNRAFRIIPQYYSKRLDDPSQLSSDLIGMICSYYENACNFANKSEIKDEVESIVDVIENRRYRILNKETGNALILKGTQSNTFLAARKFLDMNMYNIRSDNGKLGPLNLGKAAQNFSRLTQALNLGMSPAIALTGFFTAQYSHLMNAIVGDRGYGLNEWKLATGEVISHYIKNYGGVGYASNQLSNDKVMLLAEMFDVANQLKRKFKNSNRSRLVRFLDNWCFGGLTSMDFASKSTIMVTILMSHRYFRGDFLTKEDILNKLEASTEEGKKTLLEEWEKGEILYSIFTPKNGELEIEEKYKQAFEKARHKVYSRINKTAENADGMATETLKAAITTNFFGAAVLTHRQYFPLMIQQRLLPMVYDFDMLMYTQGQYLVDWDFFKNVCVASLLDLIKTKSAAHALLVLKEKYLNFTHDTSSEENWKISRARQKALKKTISELTMYFTVVVPLVGLICMFADSDDKKDYLALQLAAYIARRTQWEVFTPYRTADIFNTIKSVSAQTGTIDKIDAIANVVFKRFQPQGSLLDTLLGLDQKQQASDIIKRGVYEGHSRMYKSLMQMTPYHNLYEQWYGSKQKRLYYEKQIMKLD